MPDQDYWKERFETLNESLLKDGMDYYDEAEKIFRRAQRSIDRDIAAWYQRFADNNKISLQDAQKLLRKDELEEFKWTVEDYIKHGRENGVSADWSKQLENASARFHISRLEALKIEMQHHLEELYGNYLDGLDGAVRRTYQDSYYKTCYIMQEGFHTGFEVASLPESAVDAVIKKPWAADGMNFSDRIWRDKDKLLRTLQDELTQGLIRGDPQDAIVRRFAKRMGVSLSNAGRLIATESAFFAAKGSLDSLKDLGVEKYQFVATLDRRTSDICRSMDMKIIPVKDFQPGVTAPPLHCWCRSCTVPYMGDNAEGLRAARDEEGKTTYIPDMPYKDWKAVYVDKKKSLYSIAQPRGYRKIEITNVAIQKVPAVNLSGIDAQANEDIRECAMDILRAAKESNSSNEMMLFYNMVSREKSEIYSGTEYNVPMPQNDKILKRSYNGEVILIHNHPSGRTLSYADLGILVKSSEIGAIMAVTNAGRIRLLQKTKDFSYNKVEEIIDSIKAELGIKGEIVGEIQNQVIEEFLDRAKEAGLKYVRA